MDTIGKQIAARRKLLKLTQSTFAEKMEISIDSIKSYESDRMNPSIDVLKKMSAVFNCDLVIKFEQIKKIISKKQK